ncbi:hypothetical protein E2P81_ATG06088 [Venturia nashicola]|nr:hypothetical protein E2P81_ATG06088 [Venturia nashicola]
MRCQSVTGTKWKKRQKECADAERERSLQPSDAGYPPARMGGPPSIIACLVGTSTRTWDEPWISGNHCASGPPVRSSGLRSSLSFLSVHLLQLDPYPHISIHIHTTRSISTQLDPYPHISIHIHNPSSLGHAMPPPRHAVPPPRHAVPPPPHAVPPPRHTPKNARA